MYKRQAMTSPVCKIRPISLTRNIASGCPIHILKLIARLCCQLSSAVGFQNNLINPFKLIRRFSKMNGSRHIRIVIPIIPSKINQKTVSCLNPCPVSYTHLKYARMVQKDPKKSYCYELEQQVGSEEDAELVELTLRRKLCLLEFLFGICTIAVSYTHLDVYKRQECVNSVRSVGITAGASTPNQIIEEVHTNVRIKF